MTYKVMYEVTYEVTQTELFWVSKHCCSHSGDLTGGGAILSRSSGGRTKENLR